MSSDDSIDQGHIFYKLAQRALPNTLPETSIYSHFPFVVPEENVSIHKKLGTFETYDWSKSQSKEQERHL